MIHPKFADRTHTQRAPKSDGQEDVRNSFILEKVALSRSIRLHISDECSPLSSKSPSRFLFVFAKKNVFSFSCFYFQIRKVKQKFVIDDQSTISRPLWLNRHRRPNRLPNSVKSTLRGSITTTLPNPTLRIFTSSNISFSIRMFGIWSYVSEGFLYLDVTCNL